MLTMDLMIVVLFTEGLLGEAEGITLKETETIISTNRKSTNVNFFLKMRGRVSAKKIACVQRQHFKVRDLTESRREISHVPMA